MTILLEGLNPPPLRRGFGGGCQYATNANNMNFMSADSTHPLAPSAREGGQKEKSHNDDKNVDCHAHFVRSQ